MSSSDSLTVSVAGTTWALFLKELVLMKSNESRRDLFGVHTKRYSLGDGDVGRIEEDAVKITGFAFSEKELPSSSNTNSNQVIGQVHFRRVSGGAPSNISTLSSGEKQFLTINNNNVARTNNNNNNNTFVPKLLLIITEQDATASNPPDSSTKIVDFGLFKASFLSNSNTSNNNSNANSSRTSTSVASSSSSSSQNFKMVPLNIENMGHTLSDFQGIGQMCRITTADNYLNSCCGCSDEDDEVQKNETGQPKKSAEENNKKSRIQRLFEGTLREIEKQVSSLDEATHKLESQRKEIGELLLMREQLQKEHKNKNERAKIVEKQKQKENMVDELFGPVVVTQQQQQQQQLPSNSSSTASMRMTDANDVENTSAGATAIERVNNNNNNRQESPHQQQLSAPSTQNNFFVSSPPTSDPNLLRNISGGEGENINPYNNNNDNNGNDSNHPPPVLFSGTITYEEPEYKPDPLFS